MAGFGTSHRNVRLALLGALAGIAWASSLHAEESYSDNSALLAISFSKGRVTAGMMCNAAPANCRNRMSISTVGQSAIPSGAMCRPSSSGILNPDVLAFDVTTWPRQAISMLMGKINELGDPLNHDFSRMELAGYRVRKVEESSGDDLEPPVFELSSGCYLLVRVPPMVAAAGT